MRPYDSTPKPGTLDAAPPASILHRRWHGRAAAGIIVMLALVAGSGLLFAQSRRRSAEPRGPRALALLEVAANGRTQLVPISIFDNGRFYDAGLYRAIPRPMALEDGVVYEGERTGESLGLFTITGAQQLNSVWIGLGRWRPNNAPEPPKPKAAPAKKEDTDYDTPVLRQPKPQTETNPAGGQPSETAPQARPSPPQGQSEPEPADRPTLRRRKPNQPAQEEPAIPPLVNRSPQPQSREPAAKQPAMTTPLPPGTKSLPAISDAVGPEPRPFTYAMDAGEQQRFTQQLSGLAYAAITRFASTRPGHRPAAAAALTPTEVRVFDLHHNNEPVLVFGGRLPELAPATRSGAAPRSNPGEYWVTVVARVDMYHELRQLFAFVTDSDHLDVYPRLELIDAVDADGNGTGELLFREIFDRGHAYVLFRVGMDKLSQLFEGARDKER